MTTQPQWILVYATDYSALYRDATGVYPAELAIAQTDDDTTVTYVYRFPLERCFLASDEQGTFLCEQDPTQTDLPHPLRSYVPWFAKHLSSVANSVGSTLEDLTSALCSDDPGTLAEVYEALGGYHGYDNFADVEEWTANEFESWPKRGAKLSVTEREEFTHGYISCALWCGVMAYKHDEDCEYDDKDEDTCTCTPQLESYDDPHHEGDLTSDTLESLTHEAYEFYTANVADLRASTLTMSRAGHDFWFTRNRHGVGFWDEKSKGSVADAALDRLTEKSYAYGERNLLVDGSGKIGDL